jgi:hypothetical protein
VTDRPRWRRADAIVAIVVVLVLVIALSSPRWRSGESGPIAGGGSHRDAGTDPSGLPRLPDPPSRRHRSPFDDAITARAESLCVRMVVSQVGFALKDSIDVNVKDRYGIGNDDDGRGLFLYIDGIARTRHGRVSAWRCRMEAYGNVAGGPDITHVESPGSN